MEVLELKIILFNVFMDFIVRQALAQMPEGCGLQVTVRGVAGSCDLPASDSFHTLVTLLYADDMVLMAHDPAQLASMLSIMDNVCLRFGRAINAGKTEILLVDPGRCTPAEMDDVVLSGGTVKSCSAFKYLGGWVDKCGACTVISVFK